MKHMAAHPITQSPALTHPPHSMKSIDVLVAALALGVLAFVPALQAQGNSAGKGKAHEQQIAKIANAVGGLTGRQKMNIDAILARTQEQVQALPQDERRAKGGEIRKASMTEVRNQLTPAQQKRFDVIPPGGTGTTP